MRRSTTARRAVPAVALAISALLLAACGSDEAASNTGDSLVPAGTATDTLSPVATDATAGTSGEGDACAATIEEGTLTIATGEPAFFPWVIDDAPETGEGFEAAVGLAVAKEMGYEGDAVTWTRSTFDEAIQPGVKSFDMNLQQFSISDDRKENVDMSVPYFTSNQAIVALEGSAAEGATTVADLKEVKFGAQAGTTSLDFINEVIQPTQDVFVYDDNVGAKAALEANQIDAAVFDLPTALFVSGVEIEGSVVVGQFPAEAGGTTDEFGFVLSKGSALTPCVDAAIIAIAESGELEAIQQEWLSDTTGAAVISVE